MDNSSIQRDSIDEEMKQPLVDKDLIAYSNMDLELDEEKGNFEFKK